MALRVISALTVAVEVGVTGYIDTYRRVEGGVTGYIVTHRRRSKWRYGFFMALTVAVEGDGLYRHLPSPLRVALRVISKLTVALRMALQVISSLTVAVQSGVTVFYGTYRRR